MSRTRRQFRDSALAFRSVFANRDLRCLQLAWAGSIVGHWAFTVAVSVYAYGVGGAPAVGLVFLAVLLLGLVGAANTLVDVSGFTLLQRTAPEEVLARVFGVLQMLWLGSMGIGALLVTPVVDSIGVRAALVVTGAFLPSIVALLATRVLRIDATAEPPGPDRLALLTSTPIFAPLPGAALEHLAARLVPIRRLASAEIVRAGETGDRFYLIVEGEVEVAVDDRPPSSLGPGDYFGEIALLRDVPRTATVRARTPSVLYTLGRDDFLAAVTSHAPSRAAAEAVVDARLGPSRRPEATVATTPTP